MTSGMSIPPHAGYASSVVAQSSPTAWPPVALTLTGYQLRVIPRPTLAQATPATIQSSHCPEHTMAIAGAIISKKLKTIYQPLKSWEPIHSNGDAAISGGAELLFTTLDQSTVISDLKTGRKIHTIDGDSSLVTSISCTTICPQTQPAIFFLIAYRSLTIRIYALLKSSHSDLPPKLELLKTTAKSHEAPISISRADPTGSLFATGDSSGVVRLWDARAGHCTHCFKGHGQIISALSFDIHLPSGRNRLAVGSGDCRIRLWDLKTHQLIGLFEGGHVSVVRGLEISRDGLRMISGSRDKILNLWDLSQSEEAGQILKTIPVFETVESIGFVYPSFSTESQKIRKGKSKASSRADADRSMLVYTAGDRGVVRVWDLESGTQVGSETTHAIDDNQTPASGISDTRLDPVTNTLLVNKIDQTFDVLELPTLKLIRQIVGSHDEIVDVAFLNPWLSDSPSYLAMATNSPLVRVLSVREGDNDCRLLPGHSDIVLCLARSRDMKYFVSGSKDKTARIWKWVGVSDDGEIGEVPWKCVGICEGHVQSLGALCLTEIDNLNGRKVGLLATASQDRTVKLWDLTSVVESGQELEDSPIKLKSLTTLKIHDKDINSTDFSPDGQLFASGSQDRLGKLFSVTHSGSVGTSLTLLGVLKGHSRGIWSIKFSKHDPFIITGSGDCTIKLWSISPQSKVSDEHNPMSIDQSSSAFCSCLKTFEGHSNAILRLDFFNWGQQIVSTSSDSLVKLWDVKTQVCLATLGDETEDAGLLPGQREESGSPSHEGKIWALDTMDESGSKIITAGADSKVILWEDRTELVEIYQLKTKEAQVQLNQDVENYIRLKDFGSVIGLLIRLDKPVKLLKLFNDIGSDEYVEEFGKRDLNSITGSIEVDLVIQNLKPAQILKLLGYVRNWNSINKSTEVAQRILNVILKYHSFLNLLESFENQEDVEEEEEEEASPELKSILESNSKFDHNKKKAKMSKLEFKELLDSLLPYSERQLIRLEKINQDSSILQFILNQMNGGLCEF